MAIPDFQTVMLPLLRITQSGEITIGKVVDRLAEEFKLTDKERSDLLPSGRQAAFTNRVHWARFHLIKAGYLRPTRRAHIAITDQGSAVVASGRDRIDVKFLAQSPEYQQFKGGGSMIAADSIVVASSTSLTPDEAMRQAYAETTDALASDLLTRIRAASPAFFENLTVQLLVAMGYGGSVADAGRALGRSGDGGVDGVIDEDALGLDRIYVQAKCYAEGSPVGAGAIRDFFGALDGKKANKGLFVTTSTYTKSAIDTASGLSKRIVLIDGMKFAHLMIEHDVGCRRVEEMIVRKVDEEFFDS